MEFFAFAYGTKFGDFADFAGTAGAGAMSWIRMLPDKETAPTPEIAEFVDWMDTTSPGTDMDPLAAESWIAAKLLVESLEGCPGRSPAKPSSTTSDPSRPTTPTGCLDPIRLGQQLNQGCSIGMQLRRGTWQRFATASGFLCLR